MVIVLHSTLLDQQLFPPLRFSYVSYLMINMRLRVQLALMNVLGPFLLHDYRTAFSLPRVMQYDKSNARRACSTSRVDNTKTFARRALPDERASMSSMLDRLDGALGSRPLV